MKADAIISVENLGKKYRIAHQAERQRYTALRDVIAQKLKAPFQFLSRSRKSEARSQTADLRSPTSEDFWALKGVSFEVKQGEVVGIIGRNGAGKSTLLKILSRITEPTTGSIRLRGRVASLLEVGTGFHPELTGRENVYLNGAILGMSREEIRRKFDEIVAFAEVEKFLDTPVKRYSSGMYVRLAFAVAAHLEPEILIVDEVLAVGDAQFQQKCLGKMQDVSKGGRTVLFVSHDMGNVTKLCDKGILLNEGKVEFQGEMVMTVAKYMKENIAEHGYADLQKRGDRSGSGNARFESIELLKDYARCSTFSFGGLMTIRIVINVIRPIGKAHLTLTLSTNDGIPVHSFENLNEHVLWSTEAGKWFFEITIAKLQIASGNYVIDLWIGDEQKQRADYLTGAILFHMIQTPESGPVVPLNRKDALVFAPSQWSFGRIKS